jgi:GT2 family glycosyltransferase
VVPVTRRAVCSKQPNGYSAKPETVCGGTTAAVVIAAFDEARWPETLSAIRSVQSQTRPPDDVILVIDHNDNLLRLARQELPEIRVMPNSGSRGASGSRNTGAAASSCAVLAFLDDDAVAAPSWLEKLLETLEEPGVVGAGGRLVPLWPGTAPPWFPPEFYWVVGGSYAGLPEIKSAVRNVWSGSMALRRSDFWRVGGFREAYGKVGRRNRPEDTDLCIRVSAQSPDRTWMFVPEAVAGHRVPQARTSRRFYLERCWHEGRGKAELLRADGDVAVRSELAYGRVVFKQALPRALWSRNVEGFLRAGAMVSGLGAAAAGLAFEKARLGSGLGRGGHRANSH